ncbi:MAG: hypothetical protein IIZ40_00540 [Bacilli bacterium]|nr:hypothetical protein [Bacilli bacterium]
MDILNNLGIGYTGDYLVQGSQIDKCKKSSQLDIKYTEFCVKNGGKENSFSYIPNYYYGNVIFHLPTININQSNLKSIKETVNEIILNKVDLFVIDASTLLYETFDWSTDEEQRNYLKNMAKGIAAVAAYKKEVAIENTSFDNNMLLFGKSISNISDLLVYTRNILVEDYDFSRDRANKMIGISLNINKLITNNEEEDLDNWIKIFKNDIKCIKISNVEANVNIISKLIDLINECEVNAPIILETKDELEKINNTYKKFEYLITNKLDGKPLNFDSYHNIVDSRYNEYNTSFNSSQNGYTNLVILCMILFTVIASILMVIVEMKK